MACPTVGRVCSQETRSTPGLRSRPGSDSRRGGNSPSLEKQFPERCKQPKAIRPQGNLGHSPMLTIKMSNVLKKHTRGGKDPLIYADVFGFQGE